MKTIRRAVIDVGTNSIKLLVADLHGNDVRPVFESSKQTRLGRGFYESRSLQPEAITATVQAVVGFVVQARSLQAETIRVIATSAVREAVNASALTNAIGLETGLRVEVITGEQEADWAFKGVVSDPSLGHQPLLLLDVGGGSTEFILGSKMHQTFRSSFPIGTVRLLEKKSVGDPPNATERDACSQGIRAFLESAVAPRLDQALATVTVPGLPERWVQLVGTGGTATILARIESRLDSYDRSILEATRLSRERVSEINQYLWGLSLEERKRVVGLPPNRADVILTGVAIYQEVMHLFGFPKLRVSTRGLRWAALMDFSVP